MIQSGTMWCQIVIQGQKSMQASCSCQSSARLRLEKLHVRKVVRVISRIIQIKTGPSVLHTEQICCDRLPSGSGSHTYLCLRRHRQILAYVVSPEDAVCVPNSCILFFLSKWSIQCIFGRIMT